MQITHLKTSCLWVDTWHWKARVTHSPDQRHESSLVWSAHWWPGLSQELVLKLVTRDTVSSREWVGGVTVTIDKVWNICFASVVVFITKENDNFRRKERAGTKHFLTLDKSDIKDSEDDEVGVLPQPPCPRSDWRPPWPGPLSLCPLSVLSASHGFLCSGKRRLISSERLFTVKIHS